MVERHYAPRARLVLFDAHERAGLEAWVRGEGLRAGALVLQPTFADLRIVERVLPADPAGYARALYAALHALDDLGVEVVLAERPPESGAWGGVLDRLERASR
jgi:L-threonylcarbamoyladenylate synthase